MSGLFGSWVYIVVVECCIGLFLWYVGIWEEGSCLALAQKASASAGLYSILVLPRSTLSTIIATHSNASFSPSPVVAVVG